MHELSKIEKSEENILLVVQSISYNHDTVSKKKLNDDVILLFPTPEGLTKALHKTLNNQKD